MRKGLIIIAAALLSAAVLRAQSSEGRYAQLDSLMDVYAAAMQMETTETKQAEVDYMIQAARDSATRAHIALHLFDYYREAPLMGEEAVAVHIYDTWFASGRIPMRSEFDSMDAQLFANFNRSTLIGMQAPRITLRKPCGGKVTVPRAGTPALLWFYDTACGKCRVEAKVLPGVLDSEVATSIDMYAVYCGQSKKEWREFRRSFRLSNPRIRLVHLWDPEIESDYLRLYGVVSTPKMYIADSKGTIIGRRLEVENLAQMFDLLEEIEKIYRD